MVDQVVKMDTTFREFGAVVPSPTDTIEVPEGAFAPNNVNPTTGLPYPTFDNTPQGVGDTTPYTPPVVPEDAPVSKVNSFFAGTFGGGRDYWRAGNERMLFEPDPAYTVKEDLDAFIKVHNLRPDELEEFKRVRSKGQFDYVKETILNRRERDATTGANPFTGAIGGIIDFDLPLGLATGGVGTAVKAGRTTQRIVGAATAVAATGAVIGYTDDYTTRSAGEQAADLLVAGFAGWSITNTKRTVDAARQGELDAAIDAERAYVAPSGTIPPVRTQTLPEEQPVAPVSVFDAPDAKVQTNTGKGTTRVLAADVEAKFRSTDSTLTLESLKTGSKADDFELRLAAHRYGLRTAIDQDLTYKINPQETRVIKALQDEGYDIQAGAVRGTKQIVDSRIQVQGTTVPARVLATPESIKQATDAVLEDVLKVDDEVASIPLDSIPSFPVGSRVPLSRPLVDKDGNVKLPKNSLEHEWVAQVQSVWDQGLRYTQDIDNPLLKLLASPYSQGDNAPSLARVLESRGEIALAQIEEATDLAARRMYGVSPNIGRKEYTKAMQQVSMDAYEQLQRLDAVYLARYNADEILSTDDVLKMVDNLDTPNDIKDIVRAYIKSNFAEMHHTNITTSGMVADEVMEGVAKRGTYAPVQHDYVRARLLIRGAGDDAATVAARQERVELFLGKQIADMYEGLRTGIKTSKGTIRITPAQLGKRFLEESKNRAELPSAVRSVGIPRDDIVKTLTDQGVELEEAKQLAVKLTDQRSTAKGFTNTRQRINWDWNARMDMPDGTEFGMRDLVAENPLSTYSAYNRRVSRRAAAAKYGIPDETTAQEMVQKVLDVLPVGTNHAKAVKYWDNVVKTAMGNPVGDNIAPLARSAQTAAGSIVLAGSGLYQGVEFAVQVQKLGLLRTLPALLPAMKPMFLGLKQYTAKDALGLQEAITAQMISPDRWRRIFTQHSDDFDVTSSFHEGVEYFGQSTKFLNGSEYIKRYQIGVYASVITKAFKGASKGKARDIKFLKNKLRFTDDLVDDITKEYTKHGDNINAWDADIRLNMEQKVMSEGDNLAIHILHGEIPDFMEYTAWGKILFPFQRFIWAAHQKILRSTLIRDGAVGLAMVLAVQFPLAVMVAQLKRMSSGEEPYDIDNPTELKELIRGSVSATSGLGLFSIPIDIILNEGRNLGSSSVFVPVSKGLSLGGAAFSDEGISFRDIKESTPLNTPLPMSLLMIAFEEDE